MRPIEVIQRHRKFELNLETKKCDKIGHTFAWIICITDLDHTPGNYHVA